MTTLNIVVEGPTEESFVNRVVIPHLALFNITTRVRRVLTKQDKKRQDIKHKGGGNFKQYKRDIELWIQQNGPNDTSWYTTMIDLYAFPIDEESPYTESIRGMTDPYHRVNALEQAMHHALSLERFIPYVQLHEFEALVLCDPQRLEILFPDSRAGVRRLIREIQHLQPEQINDGPATAPSKRIINHIPEYKARKVVVGVAVTEDIGLPLLRQRCPHFNDWISRLEQLATP